MWNKVSCLRINNTIRCRGHLSSVGGDKMKLQNATEGTIKQELFFLLLLSSVQTFYPPCRGVKGTAIATERTVKQGVLFLLISSVQIFYPRWEEVFYVWTPHENELLSSLCKLHLHVAMNSG